MNKICTSIEQSKKLMELGIDVKTADMYWWYNGQRYYAETIEHNDFQKSDIPAWSLTALLDVLPPYIEDSIGMIYSLNMDKEYIEYSNPNISSLYSAYIHTTGNDNLVDACVDMIIKLHEQNLL